MAICLTLPGLRGWAPGRNYRRSQCLEYRSGRVNGDRLDYDSYNKGKNHWRGAARPCGSVSRMLMSGPPRIRSSDHGAATEEEGAQATRSSDGEPEISGSP